MSSNMKFVTMTICLAVCSSVHAQTAPPPATPKPLSTSLGVVVFPAKGQTPQKQSQDEGECYAWSKGQTGVDPMAPAPAPAATPAPAQQAAAPPPSGQRVRGAARGAAAGAIIGEVADNDASKGAAIGATAGALKGGSEARKQQAQAQQDAAKKQEAATQQQQSVTQEQLNLFKKGFAACLEPKGYTVK